VHRRQSDRILHTDYSCLSVSIPFPSPPRKYIASHRAYAAKWLSTKENEFFSRDECRCRVHSCGEAMTAEDERRHDNQSRRYDYVNLGVNFVVHYDYRSNFGRKL